MGIPGFIKWVKTNFNESIEKTLIDYENVYIDLNHVLHSVICFSDTETEALGLTYGKINKIIYGYSNVKYVYISVDGAPYYAKIERQKSSRLLMSEKINDLRMPVSPLLVSPGTKFINRLNEGISQYITSLKMESYFSPSTVPGEGELKIGQELKNTNRHGKHLVYSNDADTILIAACHTNSNKPIYVQAGKVIINMNKLISLIKDRYTNNCNSFFNYDFVFVTLLMGNDYLPKLMYVTYDKIWNAYRDADRAMNTQLTKIVTETRLINRDTRKLNTIFARALFAFATSHVTKHFQLLNTRFIHRDIKNYMSGLVWCLESYSNDCPAYDFCVTSATQHPLCIAIWLSKNSPSLPRTKAKTLTETQCACIVTPLKERNILCVKPSNCINKYFESDICIECMDFRAMNRKLFKDQYNGINSSSKIKANKEAFMCHKKTHKQLDINDLVRLINECNI